METVPRRLWRVVAAVLIVATLLAWAGAAQAQQTLYYWPVSKPVVYTVHYHPVPVTWWHWTPELGWHLHTGYNYVPHWTLIEGRLLRRSALAES